MAQDKKEQSQGNDKSNYHEIIIPVTEEKSAKVVSC